MSEVPYSDTCLSYSNNMMGLRLLYFAAPLLTTLLPFLLLWQKKMSQRGELSTYSKSTSFYERKYCKVNNNFSK